MWVGIVYAFLIPASQESQDVGFTRPFAWKETGISWLAWKNRDATQASQAPSFMHLLMQSLDVHT